MTNIGVPNKNMSKKQGNTEYDTQNMKWKCNISGKLENPQDYVNMERHVWRHQEKQRKYELKQLTTKQTPLTKIQSTRIATLLLQKTTTTQNTDEPKEPTQNTSTQDTQNTQTTEPTLWEKLELVTWNNSTKKWQCNIPKCNKSNENQKNITKHQVKQHREECKPIGRTPLQCEFCNKGYSSGILLLQHLGIISNQFTWPTCTCPLKPQETNLHDIWRNIQTQVQNYMNNRTQSKNYQLMKKKNNKQRMKNQQKD